MVEGSLGYRRTFGGNLLPSSLKPKGQYPMTCTSREKLNNNYIVGSVAVAAIFAALTGSGTVFIMVAGVLIARSLANGEIRSARIGRR